MTPDEEAAPSAEAVRAEAGRLARRLDTARDRLAAALPAQSPPSQPPPSQPRALLPPPSPPRASAATAQEISRADAHEARGSAGSTAAASPSHPAPPHSRAVPASARGATRANAPSARELGGEAGAGAEAGARIEGADDEVRTLLGPAVERLGRLAELTRALAGGTLSEEDASAAVRALAASQPTRGPR